MKNRHLFSMPKEVLVLVVLFAVMVSFIGCAGETAAQTDTEKPNANPGLPVKPGDKNGSKVYFTADISHAGLMTIYEALGRKPASTDKVAVKVHTGEPNGPYFLRPAFIKPLVDEVNGTFVESNVAYGGQRAATAMHYQVAKDNGFNDVAPVIILDETSSIPLQMPTGAHFSQNLVGAHLAEFDFLIAISHFKGHAIGGYGGAIKNMSIGIASRQGKNRIHTAGNNDNQWMGGNQDDFLESMAEATWSVVNHFGAENVLYINVMNNMSVDCDCSGAGAAKPEVHDMGILASFDPVALDQACIDLIYAVQDSSARSLIQRIESRNGVHVLEHGEKIGLGSRTYELIKL
jgi:uncharacterized Fe-S center protein